jgi:quinol monooxygenase YgiN
MECWKDQEAIDIHNATEHFTRIVPQFAALFDGPEDVKLYTVNI